MFKCLGHVLLIVALLGATGMHWAALQSVAWATMLADNVKTDSLGDAINKTFDGKHPCNLCHGIAKGKQSEKKSEFQGSVKKLDFVYDRMVISVTEIQSQQNLPPFLFEASSLHYPPLVPPPRV